MNSDFKKPKKSNIVLNFEVKDKAPKKDKQLQRTVDWKMQRLGRWTGSQLKNLMTCSAAGGKLSWNDIDKVFLLGTGALKYIYENSMERKTGRYIETGDGTKQMRYGTKVEPLIAKATKAELKKMGVKGKMKDVGFKVFPTIENAGVSSDAILIDKETKETTASVEMKACCSWSSHYDRTFDFMDEKGIDFWQTQGQMIAWGVDITYYVVAQPPSDISKYLYYEGDIMDLYSDFIEECPISIEVIKASKTHQNAMLKRIIIAEKTVNDFLKDGKSLKASLYKNIDYYKSNQDLLK